MVLLNQHGRVAEAIGSCILMVRDGTVITPPSWEGALESITVDIIEALCKTMGIPFERWPIERTELIIADEIAFVGTLNEITLISEFEGDKLEDPRVLKSIAARYRNAVQGLIRQSTSTADHVTGSCAVQQNDIRAMLRVFGAVRNSESSRLLPRGFLSLAWALPRNKVLVAHRLKIAPQGFLRIYSCFFSEFWYVLSMTGPTETYK
jgi:hypothetical protein